MSFAEEMRKEGNFTRTENGAVALNTTGDACLDLFSTIGSLRTASERTHTSFVLRSIPREPIVLLQRLYSMQRYSCGLGERQTFRTLLRYMAQHHESLKSNLDLIGVFGRYDDLYSLIGTPFRK